MNVFRTWYLLLKVSWAQAVASLLFLLCVFIFFPAGWTDAERIAARRSYLDGLFARLGDPVFWEKVLLSLTAFLVLQAVFRLFAYYFSLWAGSPGQKRR
jgi:hypothetical protein